MKHSLHHGAGFLNVDHRESPGLSWEDIPLKARLAGMTPVGRGVNFEADAYQCTHCERTIVLTAKHQDLHKRGYCPSCDHFICNRCEKWRRITGMCWSVRRAVDRAFDIVTKFISDPGHPDAKIDMLQLREKPAPSISLTDAWKS